MIAASRKFVCIRPATYEDADEAARLKALFLGRSGELVNTTFAVLDAHGERRLLPPGRSPRRMFRDASALAAWLEMIAQRHGGDEEAREPAPASVPWLSELPLALNVAACDRLPLLVVTVEDEEELARWERKLAPLCWSAELIGRLHHVAVPADEAAKQQRSELLAGLLPDQDAPLVLVIPDDYARGGRVVARFAEDLPSATLARELARALAEHPVADRDVQRHLRKGSRHGIQWKSELPVTDPGRRG